MLRRFGAGAQDIGEALVVVCHELVDARVQPAERPAVRRQHEGVCRQRLHPPDRREVEHQRVRLGLAFLDADVGRDARQDHVAADEHAARASRRREAGHVNPESQGRGRLGGSDRRAVQRHVLRRVAVADVTAPVVPADLQRVAVEQTAIRRRQLRHHVRVVVGARLDLRLRLLVSQAMGRHEPRGRLAADRGQATARHARGLVIGRADPQAHLSANDLPVLGEPMRQADVIGVHVGDDHAQHRQALEFVRENGLPRRAGRVVGDAAVDDAPALHPVDPVAQQPQVDVVELERQQHAQPAYAGRNFDRRADLGQRLAEGVLQLHFLRVHRLHQVPQLHFVHFT